MGDVQAGLPHRVTLSERKKLTMTGVSEVVSFEEDSVVMKTALGTLLVQGRDLQLKTLSPEQGQVEIAGTVSALSYEEPKHTGGWIKRLLG